MAGHGDISARDAAHAIGICPKRLRELVRAGLLPLPGPGDTYPLDAVQHVMDYYDRRRAKTAGRT